MTKVINGVPRRTDGGLEWMTSYNLIDVYGCVGLDERFEVVRSQAGRAEVSVSPIQDGIMASKLHDHAKLTLYQDRYSFDTKYQEFHRKPIEGKDFCGDKFVISLNKLEKQADERNESEIVKYNTLKDIGKVGGFVPKPLAREMYKWVAVIDFHKFYPNMIKSINAGVTTAIDLKKDYWFCVIDKDGKIWDKKNLIETPLGYFRKDKKALNAEIFDRWLRLRREAQAKAKEYKKKHGTTKTDEYKLLDNQQFNIKTFTNAGFGVFGLPIDRTYSRFVFNNTTICCQDIIMFSKEVAENLGYIIIAGDTDSIFVDLKTDNLDDALEEVEKLNKKINESIDSYLEKNYNLQTNTIEIGLETISKKFYMDVKKRYIKLNVFDGERLDEPEIEVKGMDLKKRATSQLAADIQDKLVDIMMKYEEELPKMKNYLKNLNNKLETMNWNYVCKRGALNKYLEDYPDGNESAVSARNSLKYLGTYYNPGSNPFVGIFKDYPSKFNGKFITERKGEFKMSFNEEDEQELREAGFKLDYDEIRRSQIHLKSEHILSMYGTDFYNVIEEMNQGDFMTL